MGMSGDIGVGVEENSERNETSRTFSHSSGAVVDRQHTWDFLVEEKQGYREIIVQ